MKPKELRKYLPDFFVPGLITMILLAWIFPGIGAEGSPVELKALIRWGISLLFFFYGLRLEPRGLKNDLKNWKVHLLIQSITYLMFPLIVLAFYPLFAGSETRPLWLAIFFLAALPSTVSSSVVMVSIAGGNIPTAIFNASISGLIGIIITPLWTSLFLNNHGSGFSFAGVIADLVIQIMLPLVLGLLLHGRLGGWASRHKKRLGMFDKTVIFCIVYNSFSNSFIGGTFRSIELHELSALTTAVIILFFIVFGTTRQLTKRLNFRREDRITILFCGSKKSLVHGSVMASVMFAGSPYGSLFLVPVMIYHAFQLFFISIVAHRYGREAAAQTT